MVRLFGVLQSLHVFLIFDIVLIVIFLRQSSQHLHSLLFQPALSAVQFIFYSLVFFRLLRKIFIFLFQLLEICLRIVLSQIFHLLLFYQSLLLLSPLHLDHIFLIQLDSFEFQFLGSQFMIGNIDEGKFVFFRFFLSNAKFYLQVMNLLKQLVEKLGGAEHLDNFFMSFFVTAFILLFEIQQLFEFVLVHFLLQLFSPLYGFPQLLSHPYFHFLLPFDLFLRYLDNNIKVNFYDLDHRSGELVFPVMLVGQVMVDLVILWFLDTLFGSNYFLEVPQLFGVIICHLGILFIDITKKAVSQFVFQLGIFQQNSSRKQLERIISAHVDSSNRIILHFAFNYAEHVNCVGSHAYYNGGFFQISFQLAVDFIKVSKKSVNAQEYFVKSIALEELAKYARSAVYGISEWF